MPQDHIALGIKKTRSPGAIGRPRCAMQIRSFDSGTDQRHRE
jgi:hypothetical protein